MRKEHAVYTDDQGAFVYVYDGNERKNEMPFYIERNDLTKLRVDAIVNTANPRPVYGSGLDTAVYMAAGAEELLKAREEIGPIECGSSAITPGFKLPAGYIIHTVGTYWSGGNSGEEEIVRSCYKSALALAEENGCTNVAFPLLASGCYGFPKGIALRIALSEIEAFLKTSDMTVYLVVFDRESFDLSEEFYGDIDSYIDENYVEEKSDEEYDISCNMSYDISVEATAEERRRRLLNFRQSREAAPRPMECGFAAEPRPVAAAKAKPSRSLDDVIGAMDKTFMEMVFSFADARGITDVELQKKANLDKRTFSKLKCGTTKKPSQTTALALAIGLELGLDDTKDLLSRAGLALSPCSKLDLIVKYFIEREVYDINAINVALFEHGEALLGSQVV